jgi:hypothetical protein
MVCLIFTSFQKKNIFNTSMLRNFYKISDFHPIKQRKIWKLKLKIFWNLRKLKSKKENPRVFCET